MAAHTEPEIVLYDLACTKNICFSPAVWRIRLMLNYKHIPYRTIFLEFPDIEPTLKGLGLAPSKSSSGPQYTVPAIHHVPTNTHIMDSAFIAPFLERTYPAPPLPLTSSHARAIERRARAAVGPAFRTFITPRELLILSPRAQAYFRRTREAALGGQKLEDLLEPPEKEEQAWRAVEGAMREVGELMREKRAEGPFVLGARPCGTDFFVAGAMRAARVVDEGVWRRVVAFPGFGEVYEACEGWMGRED